MWWARVVAARTARTMVRGGARGHCPSDARVCQCPAGGPAHRARAEPGWVPRHLLHHFMYGPSNIWLSSKPPCIENSSKPPRAMAVQVSTSRLIVTFARRGLVTQARGPIRDSFVLGPAHRAHTSRHAIPVEEPAAHSVAPGVRLWSRSKKLWQVQEVPTHTANVESLVTVAQNLPNTSQPSRLARGRLSRAWSEATWSDVVHSK